MKNEKLKQLIKLINNKIYEDKDISYDSQEIGFENGLEWVLTKIEEIK